MSALTPADALRFRLPSFGEKVARADRVVRDALALMRRPQVAFSGGKDSLVVLDLVLRQRPDAAVVWSDDELEYDEQETYVTVVVPRYFGCTVTVTLGHARHGGWFDPWRARPYWRDPVPGAVFLGERVEDWSARRYDGCFVGLRRQEAPRRRVYLAANGRLHRLANGQWRCNPLAGWTVDDVFAYVAGSGLPLNPVYDVLAGIGVDRAAQRVGPLPLSPGWHLRLGWPAAYRRLVERYGQRWAA